MDRLNAFVHVAGKLFRPGDVPESQVADLITNPKAWRADDWPAPAQAPADETSREADNDPDEEADTTEGATGHEDGDATGGDSEQDQTPVPTADADEEPERPAKSAKVDVWREYILAVADVTRAEVNEMTKEELIDAADQLDADTE